MLMTGPDPVVHIPVFQISNNDLVDERPMDEPEDEHLDFADQCLYHPLHSNCTRYRIQYHTSSTRLLQRPPVATFLWPASEGQRT